VASERPGAPVRRPEDPAAWRPLRRRPKQLDAEPTLFQPGGGGGPVLRAEPGAAQRLGAAGNDGPPGASVRQTTDEQGELVALPGDGPGVDLAVRAMAQEIASRLAMPRPRRQAGSRRGVGELASLPYRGGSDDIDLDRTLEVLTERPVPEDSDIVVRDRLLSRRSVVVVVDVSGSMRGERVQVAAATVGALAGQLARDDVAVLAFWSDAAVLLPFGRAVRPLALLDDLLRIPARGLTNVAFPLAEARARLAAARGRDSRVLLLSDCVHNAGPDPRPEAVRLPRLDVLVDVSGEHDLDLARDLAAAGRGLMIPVRSHRDVAPALERVFAR
jgi:Mg-chelatase subunit ChlD